MINIKPLLETKNLDAIFLASPKLDAVDPAFTYFTGLRDFEKAFYIGGSAQKVYVADFEAPRAKKESILRHVVSRPDKGLDAVLKKMKGQRVGINGNSLPLFIYRMLRKNNIHVKDIANDLQKMMAVKTPEEVAKIKKAINLTKRMFALAKSGKSELDIAAEMSAFTVKNQAELAFDSIISYGKNSALPHAKPTETRSGNNCCLLVDIGAKWKGYCADVTRTFGFRGASQEFCWVHDIVQEAHDLAIDAIEPGKTVKEISDVCEGHLKKHGYKLVHSTGHGIGITIHEWPYISKKFTTKLEPGMVFTIEPGVYIKGKFGIRIEDDILVTKTGREVLSNGIRG